MGRLTFDPFLIVWICSYDERNPIVHHFSAECFGRRCAEVANLSRATPKNVWKICRVVDCFGVSVGMLQLSVCVEMCTPKRPRRLANGGKLYIGVGELVPVQGHVAQ